ncbi:tRNA-modifying protein YgfZ [Buchnera aphidicola]|uniref:tRNA-modifying protein YgfZ n=1 Tax=Buchnera aphidicola TaxID=9 RepID=UPI0022383C67|nr:tRNA-modifying protein YgfZ [Buchnera aphidicola]MCW5197552.1 tRNA-modifying protein YgfZ [Buchnera aphidicola (Chaitophorus viminalis)]
MKNFYFQKNIILPIENIFFSIVYLDELVLIKISGKDKKKYLQNQITSDIKFFPNNKYFFCGNCNYQGKIFSTILLFKRKNSYFYILRKSVYKKQIQEMKKYSIFFDVKITLDKKFTLLGILGKESRFYLNKIIKVLPNKKNSILHKKNITMLWFKKKIERFLFLYPRKKVFNFLKKNKKNAIFNYSDQWSSVDIEEKIPIIEKNTSVTFFPQNIHLHKFPNGISFTKGCYIGQEQISKIKYKKLNNKCICVLYSLYINERFTPGDFVYIKNNNSWIRKGVLLSSVKVSKKFIYAQVVLNKFFKNNFIYKINNSYFYNY